MTESTALPKHIHKLHNYFSRDDDRTDSWLLEYAAKYPDLGLEKYPHGRLKNFELTPELLGKLAPLYLASAIEWANTDPQNLPQSEDRDIVGLLGSLACALPYADQQTQNAVVAFIQNYHGHGNFGGSDQNIGEGFFILAASAYALPNIADALRSNLFATIIKPVVDEVLAYSESEAVAGDKETAEPEKMSEVPDGLMFLIFNPRPDDVALVTNTFIQLYRLYAKSPGFTINESEPGYSYFSSEAHPLIIRALTPIVSEDLIADKLIYSANLIGNVFPLLKKLADNNEDNGQYIPVADKVLQYVRTQRLGYFVYLDDNATLNFDDSVLARLHAAMPDEKKLPFATLIREKIAAVSKEERDSTPSFFALSSWLDARHPVGAADGAAPPTNGGATGAGGASAPGNVCLYHMALQVSRGGM